MQPSGDINLPLSLLQIKRGEEGLRSTNLVQSFENRNPKSESEVNKGIFMLQRPIRGRAGRVLPGECFHLYPRCVYDAFSEYQLPELLRTPLNSLCFQIKSLEVGSIGEFLSAALQPPEPLVVQNDVDFLKMIGALDEIENLTHLGKYLAILPLDPKLGKMLIMGAFFRCFDPILTIVVGLSVRDPFLLPQEKKDQASTTKSRFSAKDYSDHMALVRAYEGWKEAEREGSAYEYCWRNFLSAQTLKAIHSLRNQFIHILKDAQLLETKSGINNRLSHNQSLVRAIICSGLFPGIASVVHRETSMSFKTMDDGQVLLYAVGGGEVQYHGEVARLKVAMKIVKG
ncbi:unnamed protein product [Lactuca virosa]|uniref:RNA helicase n=1 Tax=Lactuca virosa TaxID=75947 RepID=A0AAU9LTJ6_9ASTR|nr:unnamed protein product [Lactuca virosa]